MTNSNADLVKMTTDIRVKNINCKLTFKIRNVLVHVLVRSLREKYFSKCQKDSLFLYNLILY